MHPRTYQFFEELAAIHHNKEISLSEKIRKQRTCLERVCKTLSRDDGITFSNLQGRLDYVCNKSGLSAEEKGKLHTFRIQANKVIHENVTPELPDYYWYLKTLAEGFAGLFQAKLPREMKQLYQNVEMAGPKRKKVSSNKNDLRGIVQEIDRGNKRFTLLPDTENIGEPLMIKYDVHGKNLELIPSVELLNEGDVVQLACVHKFNLFIFREHCIFVNT